MALASGSSYYMAPASAKKMANDLAVLPAWYADAGSDVLVNDFRQVDWLRKGCGLPLPVTGVLTVSEEHREIVSGMNVVEQKCRGCECIYKFLFQK